MPASFTVEWARAARCENSWQSIGIGIQYLLMQELLDATNDVHYFVVRAQTDRKLDVHSDGHGG